MKKLYSVLIDKTPFGSSADPDYEEFHVIADSMEQAIKAVRSRIRVGLILNVREEKGDVIVT